MTLHNFRRVVTGVTSRGKSVFIHDGLPPRLTEPYPGCEMFIVWSTDDVVQLPTPGRDETVSIESFSPSLHGTRFLVTRWPAGSKLLDDDLRPSPEEFAQRMPGIAETVESEDPSMHTTDTIDYGVVISGEMWLELDDGAEVHLCAGDCVVQNGTRHAWRNRGKAPTVMAFVMVGAHRS
jgi:mannose-6-phosphate isomerase-like protein (cupin superfamily)